MDAIRSWRLGESFEDVARRFLPLLRGPIWGADRVLELLGITKRRRTAYDHYMLQLHDRMKADSVYQSQVAQRTYDFKPGAHGWSSATSYHMRQRVAACVGADLSSASQLDGGSVTRAPMHPRKASRLQLDVMPNLHSSGPPPAAAEFMR